MKDRLYMEVAEQIIHGVQIGKRKTATDAFFALLPWITTRLMGALLGLTHSSTDPSVQSCLHIPPLTGEVP